MKYKQVRIATTGEFADIVSLMLIEAGSEGTSITDVQDVKDILRDKNFWDYYDEKIVSGDETVYVSGCFAESFSVEKLLADLETLKISGGNTGTLESYVSVMESADWENEWRKYYAPIEYGCVTIVPKWLACNSSGVQVLLDPGMAFGTGNHETTGMCVRLIQEYDLIGKTVYDVGCGSGILGITAAKLGAKMCRMTDVDDNAVKASRENAELNGVGDVVRIDKSDLLGDLNDKADMVIANITADILLRLKEQISDVIKPGGVVILSGIINARAQEITEAYAAYRLDRHLQNGEWQAFAYIAP